MSKNVKKINYIYYVLLLLLIYYYSYRSLDNNNIIKIDLTQLCVFLEITVINIRRICCLFCIMQYHCIFE